MVCIQGGAVGHAGLGIHGHQAAECHNIHDDDRVEPHGEHGHGHAAKALGFGVHSAITRGICLVDLARCEGLQVLEKAVAELGILIPIFGENALGDLLHRHDGRGIALRPVRNQYSKVNLTIIKKLAKVSQLLQKWGKIERPNGRTSPVAVQISDIGLSLGPFV